MFEIWPSAKAPLFPQKVYESVKFSTFKPSILCEILSVSKIDFAITSICIEIDVKNAICGA